MKKQSKSFKDAVSRVLGEKNAKKKKTDDELIEELYGGRSGGGGAPSSVTVAGQQGTGFSRGMMPPFSSAPDAAAQDGGIDMRDLQPDNDVTNPTVMPFPLETTIDHLGYAGQQLAVVLGQINTATENPALPEEKVKMLKKLDNKIKTILGHISKVAEEITDTRLD